MVRKLHAANIHAGAKDDFVHGPIWHVDNDYLYLKRLLLTKRLHVSCHFYVLEEEM